MALLGSVLNEVKNRLTKIATELGLCYDGLPSFSFPSGFLEARVEEVGAFTSTLLLVWFFLWF